MDENNTPNDHAAEFADSSMRRQDVETARIVNQGLMFQERAGTDCAAAYLKNLGISLDVALRVLARPTERRK
ncbi:MAG: hypothetical protein VB032_09110 [Burkholderiaceae bacterium]|nr:hypothetical protein [Burkholderiaceae bacterium]